MITKKSLLLAGALASAGLSAFLSFSCASRPHSEGPGRACATRYPIVLVHGIAGKEGGPLPYWGGIPARLRDQGADLSFAKIDSFPTVEQCARQLSASVDEVLARTGAAKVNLIAHSMGGLGSRYYISTMGKGDKVASLSTFNTPHRGSAIAQYYLEGLPGIAERISDLVDLYSLKVAKDSSCDSYAVARELTPAACELFNERNADDPRVYYQSFTTCVDADYDAPGITALYHLLYEREGPNDGLVSLSSAKWGNFRGVIGADRGLALSHAEIIDIKTSSNGIFFDAPAVFASIVSELKSKGF